MIRNGVQVAGSVGNWDGWGDVFRRGRILLYLFLAAALLMACGDDAAMGDDTGPMTDGGADTDAAHDDVGSLDASSADAVVGDARLAMDAGDDTGPPPMDAGGCEDGLTLCGGGCVDLSRSLDHCGRCGARCAPTMAEATAMCAAPQCFETYVVQRSEYGDSVLAQDATHIYWFSDDETPAGRSREYSLVRWPKTGGAVEVLATDISPLADAMVVEGGSVLWTGRGIHSLNIRTGVITDITPRASNHLGLAVDGDNLYTLDYARNLVLRINRSSGAEITLAELDSTPKTLQADSTHVYWSTDTTVARVSKSGGAVQMLASGQDSVLSLALDATHVYWANYLRSGSIHRVPKTGGAVVELSAGFGNPNAIRVAGGYVYWTGYLAGLRRVPSGGGTATRLSGGRLFDLEVDGSRVFTFRQHLSPLRSELRITE